MLSPSAPSVLPLTLPLGFLSSVQWMAMNVSASVFVRLWQNLSEDSHTRLLSASSSWPQNPNVSGYLAQIWVNTYLQLAICADPCTFLLNQPGHSAAVTAWILLGVIQDMSHNIGDISESEVWIQATLSKLKILRLLDFNMCITKPSCTQIHHIWFNPYFVFFSYFLSWFLCL